MGDQLHGLVALPRERTPISFEDEAGWTPDPIWMFWRKENVFAYARIRTPYCPVRSRVTIPTTVIRMRSGLKCPKYPYSGLIRVVPVTHLLKIRVESTVSDTVEAGPVRV